MLRGQKTGAKDMPTRQEHYYRRGFEDAMAGKPATRMSEPAYARGYAAGTKAKKLEESK